MTLAANHAGIPHRRNAARVRLRIPADFLTLDGHRKCWLEDLSSSGARLRIEPPPAKGASGFLNFCGTETFGTVVWAWEKTCGMAFDEELPHDTVVALRRMADDIPDFERLRHTQAIRDWVEGRGRIIVSG